MTLHIVKHGFEPSGFHADIAVEQQAEFTIYLGDGFVVAFGKAVIAVEYDSADVGELLGHQFERAIGAAIVCHNDLSFGRVLDD